MSRIHILPDHLISQIAAGEVVERPSSVVKELLENALDASAEHLEIDLEVGGKRRIRVRDDGHGMGRDDALRAFDRHATSKIASFEDLEAVATLGFRGEALASIAAVSRVELVTSAKAGEGFTVRIDGGAVRRAEPIATPVGTTIDVRSLFFNVPARRRFLKAPRTELQRCSEVIQAYAMARPDVGITARHEGRVLLESSPGGRGLEGLERRLQSLFGDRFVGELAPIGPLQSDRLTVSGFIGGPRTARSRRRFTFVNQRLIRDRALMATFYRAVRDEWRSDEFPALFLFIDLPGHELDVNVHPQKSEVRFRDRQVFDRIYSALRQSLAAARGEEPIQPAAPTSLPSAPLAWQGRSAGAPGGGHTGEPGDGSARWQFDHRPAGGPAHGGDIAEPGAPPFSDPRLPQATLAPLEPRPVPLSGRSGEERPFRLLGQYKGTVILLEGPDGLYLVDQHVAHERILYERIRRNLQADAPQSQKLLQPHLLELSPTEVLRVEPLFDELEHCGFSISQLSESTLAVTALPLDMGPAQVEVVIQDLARGNSDTPTVEDLRRRLIEDAAASMSCRSAVKMHDPLTGEEMERLISELFDCEQPYTCPHGRPVFLKLGDDSLERGFKRR